MTVEHGHDKLAYNRSEHNGGFTLVELLVVISVIALLLSILMPSLQKARMLAIRVTCASNARQTSLAMMAYGADNDDRPPGARYNFAMDYTYRAAVSYNWGPWQGYYTGPTGVGLLHTGDYIKGPSVFFCPGRRKEDPYSDWDNSADDWVDLGKGGMVDCSYLAATSDVATEGTSEKDFGEWHRFDKTPSSKPLYFEVCFSDDSWKKDGVTVRFGATRHRHGLGYNFAFFDGSAKWMPDRDNYLETAYRNTSLRHWSYGRDNLIYYIMTEFIGGWKNHHER